MKKLGRRTLQIGQHPLNDKARLIDLYINKQVSSYELARIYNISTSTVQYYLKKYRIPQRRLKEAIKIKTDRQRKITLERKYKELKNEFGVTEG